LSDVWVCHADRRNNKMSTPFDRPLTTALGLRSGDRYAFMPAKMPES
jgi:hypothetical protein